MSSLKKLLVATVGTVFATVVVGEKILAVTLTETTDAGATLNTAAAVNTYPLEQH